jgi:hypothetical protein
MSRVSEFSETRPEAWKTSDPVIEIDVSDPDDRLTVRMWVDGNLAADVKSITVTAFDVAVTMTNGVTVDVPRGDPRLMATLGRAVSTARREAPPQRQRPLKPADADTDTEVTTDFDDSTDLD